MNPAGQLLIIDDEPGVRQVLARHMEEVGHMVQMASGLEEGMTFLVNRPFDLVYCDIRLSGQSGLDLLARRETFPGHPLIIMMTGFPSLETAQQALREGAFDYLEKPIRSEALLRSVSLALTAKRLRDERKRLHFHLEAVFDIVEDGLVTVDPELRLVAANRAAAKICGFHPREAGHPLDDPFKGCGGNCLELLRQALVSGERVSGKRLSCRREGEGERVVSATAIPMGNRAGDCPGAVLALHDETSLVRLEERLDQQNRFHRQIGDSPAMREVYRLVESLADLETTVLILGESGTGKELVAEALHRQGRRRQRPLVKINCGALSETLLESELFGHVRGAFTGALKDRTGRFQEADGGTLFLDEIGDISPAMQLRLLRVLQNKHIERVGDNRSIPVDVRIVAATHQNLRAKVASGAFREDLYYRLKVVEIELPPLRARGGDLLLLIEHFCGDFNARFHRRVQGIASDARNALMEHSWPGNIRELEHALEHAFVVCRGEWIELEHLPRELHPVGQSSLPATPEFLPANGERDRILAALTACRWHRERAAEQLGMSRATLFRWMRRLGIQDRTTSSIP
ncbi:MAG: sigma 54-interacting transcriptional regulator [Magnetococcales bacterium]|nr:sigma 54-interacting transcriptional regulator [Magnetococcales bacterium]